VELVDVATLDRCPGAAPRPDGYDWLRLLAYVRTQSQIGWVAVSDSESGSHLQNLG